MRPRRGLILLSIVALLVVASAPAAAGKPKGEPAGERNGPKPRYFVDETKLPFDALEGATAYWGVHKGAGYRIEVPDDWNGSLVMWAHGFRGTGLELTVDDHPLREVLIDSGFAWAASSYSANDYDVAAGVKDTHALVKLFNGIVGKPDRVYVTGASMGGHITAVSIEQYPATYDGAMPICGVLGDYELFDYFLDFNLAAQQLGTGSSTFPVDPIEYLTETVPTIKENLGTGPLGWPLSLTEDGEDLKALTELRSGGVRPNFDLAWFFWNGIFGDFLFELGIGDGTLLGRPGVLVDNHDVVYQFDTDTALSDEEKAFNEAIFRVQADPQGRHENGLANVPPILGDPPVPVLSLHNLGDLFVPFHMEIEYAKRVAEHGKSDLLVQRAIRGVGHCDFTGIELATAFFDLVGWVEHGVKPEGDVVLDPAVVASADYGCRFTDFSGLTGDHYLPEPCPSG